MKKIITVTLCIVLVLLFAGCGKNGDTSKVEIDYGASSVYSKDVISAGKPKSSCPRPASIADADSRPLFR